MNQQSEAMKNTLVILAIPMALSATAQNSAVVNAYNYMQDGDLVKAAEYIEPAITNEATAGKEKTWRYRGDIYRLIAYSDKPELKTPQFSDALQKAVESYLKANELDTKGAYKEDNIRALGQLQVMALNGGNDAFTAKNFDHAIAMYGMSEKIAKAFNQVDSNAVFNSALAYEAKGDGAMAMGRYRELIAMGYNKVDIYRFLANQQKTGGDRDGAIATTQEGLKAHPGNKELLLDLVALQLEAGKMDEVDVSVSEALKTDPNNATLHMLKGQIYDQRATKAKDEAEMKKNYEAAEAAYKKALEIDPKNFDAAYNIGVLYNNRAAYEYEKIKDIKSDDAYAKAKKVADDTYLMAIPHFETAHAIRPDDMEPVKQLKVLYAKSGNTAKFEEMKKLLGQ